MRNRRWTPFFVALALLSCAGKKVTSTEGAGFGLEVLREGFVSPFAMAANPPENYFVADLGPDQKFVVTKIHREKSEVLFSGLNSPKAMTYDFRHGRLFVADRGTIKIFRVRAGGIAGVVRSKKPDEPPKEIPVPGAGEITSVAYSLMNARAYACDPKAKKIWSLDPKKGAVEEVLGPGQFDSFGQGEPLYLLVSSDGKRLYLVTSKAGDDPLQVENAVVRVDLKKRELTLIRSFPGVTLAGLEIYRSHFIVADQKTGEVFSLSLRNREVEKLSAPPDWTGPISGFGMDLDRVVFLTPEGEETQGKLVRFKITVKE